MNRILSIFLVGFLLFGGCKNKSAKTNSSVRTTSDSTSSIESNPSTSEEVPERTVTTLKFADLEVTIHYLAVDGEIPELITSDTVTILAEVGESIEDQKIIVSGSDLKVDYQYETSLTISKEGPHCDLTNWKHFYSDWKPLKKKGNEFQFPSISTKDRERFIEVSMDEVKEAVKAECGDDWAEMLNKTTNIHEYPCGVGISRYFIRISGKTKAGAGFQKVIVIESPMGC